MNDNNGFNEGRRNDSTPVILAESTGQEKDLKQQVPAETRKAVENTPLHWLKGDQIQELQSRLNLIQFEFVNDPRASVKQVDELVADASTWIQQAFSQQRIALNQQWYNHPDTSTEDLRIVLQSYRSFLNLLLEI